MFDNQENCITLDDSKAIKKNSFISYILNSTINYGNITHYS